MWNKGAEAQGRKGAMVQRCKGTTAEKHYFLRDAKEDISTFGHGSNLRTVEPSKRRTIGPSNL